ncbi:MAG: class I SAM-dependent methyltransferase [Candidatus Kerfeldbacteria bacterium]
MEFTGERVVPERTPERIYLDHLERYRFSAQYVKGRKVVDIACGTGYGTALIADRGATDITGIDISSESINYARKKYQRKNLRFLVGDAMNIPLADESADVIVSYETIEHVPDYGAFLAEVKRVLRPGGTLIISSPNRLITSPNKGLHDRPDNRYHNIEFTADEFQELMLKTYSSCKFFGQRQIPSFFMRKLIRRIISFISNRLKINFKNRIFQQAGGPKVKQLRPHFEPRYIVAVCTL